MDARLNDSLPGLSFTDITFKADRLRTRRLAWFRTTCGSLVALVGYFIIGGDLFQSLTGVAAVISLVPLLVFAVLMVTGLAGTIISGVRLHRLEAGTRPDGHYAGSRSSHARQRTLLLAGWLAFAVLTFAALAYLPRQVDAAAYLEGAGHAETFLPLSYNQVCGRTGCSTVTDGVLVETGQDVSWPAQVPLDQSFTVRAPLWAVGSGTELNPDDSSAVMRIILGLFFEIAAAGFALAVMPKVRRRLAVAGLRVAALIDARH
jgi:hypothetical protein